MNTGSFPLRAWDTMVPTADEITIGRKLPILKSLRRAISSANRTPATGALNVAAIPAATPQAIKTRIFPLETLNSCPINPPIAPPPSWAMGPSCPADPPNPSVIQEPSVFAIISLGFSSTPLKFTFSRNCGKP